MRPLLLAGLVVLGLGIAGPFASLATADQPSPKNPATTVEVGPDDDQLWPYTSRSQSFAGRTLVVNVIITEDPQTVETLLNRRADTDWEMSTSGAVRTTSDTQQVASNWRTAHGSMRYTHVKTESGDGTWLKQRYQLHVGTYLGTRDHIRAFAPSDQSGWTALQAHSEYWDWFRLRHTVTDVRGTAELLESDFQQLDGVSVERQFTENSGPLARGIVVVSAILPLLVSRTRLSRVAAIAPARRNQAVTVFGLALATPLAIRGAGIALERAVPYVTPKLFAVLLYPCLAVVLPLGVVKSAADLPAWLGGTAAAVGLTTAFALEFAFMGVAPPPAIIRHRLLLGAALGLLAGSGGGRRSLFGLSGVTLWLWGLFAALFGFV